jgi:hypothetical protein
MGAMLRRLVACLTIALALLGAAAGPAAAEGLGGNSLSELAERQETQTSTAATTRSSTTESGGNSRTLILVALGVAVVLLAGIGYVIVRDARRVAPGDNLALAEGRSARDAAARVAKRRAKAKAARRQRKRTRRA